MVDKQNFIEKIRFYRNKLGMTQAELAEKMHVSFQAISSWECGNTLPDLDNLCELSSVLGVPVDTLLRNQNFSDEQSFIGIDGGGTSTEFALFTNKGRILKCFKLPGTNASNVGVSYVLSIFCQGIDCCLSTGRPVKGIFMGCAGGLLDEVYKKLSEIYPDIPIHIDSDGVNALLSADGDAAMICGTGMVFFRHEPNGSYKKFAGWGHEFGDYGSAYNYGREAICAARAYEDGVKLSSLIYSIMKENLGAQTIKAGTNELKDVSEIAGKAYIIFEAYKQNDPYAEEIIHSEMKRLARVVQSVCPKGGRIIACGGINQHYGNITLPILKQYVSENTEFILPALPPIYGACRAACRYFDIPTDEGFFKTFSSDYRKITF
ncbi:MAG: XRE family transcriptional regulator [Ruminococcaceae bacterium]|nr:XRE family transcriptional regulator [Oscillospiraceae bacterium]